ncbi:MAG: tyrosine recombinase XerC [Nitrosomonas sp.]|nr:MAG: tyrosine recombinase XerC [Nitrosomonas sp.]
MNESLDSLLDTFLHYLINERRLSAHTVGNYTHDIRVLGQSLDCHDLQQVQSANIRMIIAQLHSKGLSGKSLSRMLSAWRSFYNFLVRRHRFQHNPCTGVKVPKSPNRLPVALSPDEAARLLEFPVENLLMARDSAMFELFYSSGLRLAELAQLKLSDIDCTEKMVRVMGKGNKARIVPVGKFAIAALQRWFPLRAQIVKPGVSALFLSQHGDAISMRTVSHRLKQHAQRQGIQQNVHPHILRHSFASHLLQSSGDLRAVQEMLGHTSIASTQVYTHLDFQHLTKIYDTTHPRAKKRSQGSVE